MSAEPACLSYDFKLSDLEESCQRPPNLNDYLFTNIPPYEPHRSEFQRVLQRATSSLFKVETQIALLRFEPIHYQLHHRLSTLIKDCKTVLSPVRKLNDDLLYEIFSHFAMPTPTENNWISLDDALPTSLNQTLEPWVFSQVSRSWRDVAISCPKLWQNVTISLGYSDNFNHPQAYPLTLQLERSANVPLYISLSASPDVHTQSPTFQLLLASCNRWKHLLLRLEPVGMSLLTPLKGLLPNLQKVYLPPSLARTHCTALHHAPNLTSIVGWAPFIAPILLPWTQITEFKAENLFNLGFSTLQRFEHIAPSFWSPEPILNLLTCMPNLEKCFLCCTHSLTSSSKPILQHDRLRDLTLIDIAGQGGARYLLDRLTLPRLNKICYNGSDIPAESILGLFTRSEFRLEKLLLYGCCAKIHNSSHLESPSEKTLKVISHLATGKVFLRRLILNPKQGEVRVLESLKTVWSKVDFDCDGATIYLLEKRCNLDLQVEEAREISFLYH